MTDLDPTAIRQALQLSRERGAQFAPAWREATASYDAEDEGELLKFMRKHFEAAYCDNPSPLGRCLVPEFDAEESREPYVAPEPSPDHKRCRSGDGCDRAAVRGRFGRTFCERHGAELERMAVEVADYTERHNPRTHGNTSVIGYKRHVAA